MPASSNLPLYLFAKEPVAGKVKTRLAPRLGADRCADLAADMLWQSAQLVNQGWPGQQILCVTPDTAAPAFTDIAEKLDCQTVLQSGVNLGARLQNALELGGASAAAVMGCDVPHCPPQILQQAWDQLSSGRHVIGAAEDGGFYLLGLRNPNQSSIGTLFEGVAWGGETVFDTVMKNARRLDMVFTNLPVLRDIDEWDDLVWLAGRDRRYRHYVEDTRLQAK